MWLELEVSNYIVYFIVKDIKVVVLRRFIVYSRNGEFEMKLNFGFLGYERCVI